MFGGENGERRRLKLGLDQLTGVELEVDGEATGGGGKKTGEGEGDDTRDGPGREQ